MPTDSNAVPSARVTTTHLTETRRPRRLQPFAAISAFIVAVAERMRPEPAPTTACGRLIAERASVGLGELDARAPTESEWLAWSESLHPAEAELVQATVAYTRAHGDDPYH